MRYKRYGIRYAGSKNVQPTNSIAEAQFWIRQDDVLMVREVTVTNYCGGTTEEYSDWTEAHCEYGGIESCSRDLGEISGHIVCFYCWAKAFEHMQAELRWRQLHRGDKQAA